HRIVLHGAVNAARPTEGAGEAPRRHRRPELANDFVASRNELEATIAGVWQELLGFGEVGIHDDFFDLGGHSRWTMQVGNRLRETFQVPPNLQTPFDAPTVAELARVITESELRPGQAHEIAQLAQGIERLSSDEVERMLQEPKATGGYAG